MLITIIVFAISIVVALFSFFFFFNDTATTEIYTLSLHDALPISAAHRAEHSIEFQAVMLQHIVGRRDRKSTRLNSSHGYISYAVFCSKKKKKAPSEVSTFERLSNANSPISNRPHQ